MNVRTFLDTKKKEFNIASDEEFSIFIGASKASMDKWIQRNKLPDKWRLIIGQKSKEAITTKPISKLLSSLHDEDKIEVQNFVDKIDGTNHINEALASIIAIPKLSIKASAGHGNNLECIDTFKSGEVIHVDKSLFKSPPKNIKAVQVDGYSMLPMLLPDSWVFFDEANSYYGEGLYVLNLDNELIVKLLQKNPINGVIKIISVNKDYESYEYDSNTSDIVFRIVGKVVRVMM